MPLALSEHRFCLKKDFCCWGFLKEAWTEMYLCHRSFLERKEPSALSKKQSNSWFPEATVQNRSIADLVWLNFVHLSQILYQALCSALSQRGAVPTRIIRVKYSLSLNHWSLWEWRPRLSYAAAREGIWAETSCTHIHKPEPSEKWASVLYSLKPTQIPTVHFR